MGMCPILAPFT